MAGLRSGARQLSFDALTTVADDHDLPLLRRSTSESQIHTIKDTDGNRKQRNNKKIKECKNEFDLDCGDCIYTRIDTIKSSENESVCTVITSVGGIPPKLRNVEDYKNSSCVNSRAYNSTEIASELIKRRVEMNVMEHEHVVKKHENKDELKHVIGKQEPKCDKSFMEISPVKYLMEEMYGGNSLRATTSIAEEKEREIVYDTLFHMPWRCELLINVGYFICLDSFLSVLTIMPMRILTASWRLLNTNGRQFEIEMVSAAELSDFGCSLIMACGIFLLQQTDISLIYHMIRGQGTIKLYVVYNVLEIFDRLCQNFGGDVLQTLFNSAHGLANSSLETRRYWLWRFIYDEALAIISSIVHSFILLAQAITLSTCMVAHNNALFALLVSNNFTEIKSDVFKRFSKDNIQNLVYIDSIERFHISAFLVFILAQNILEAEGAWFENYLCNAFVVYIFEMMIDIVKHSFIAKFNEVKPIVYTEFLEDLCKQNLNTRTGNAKKYLTFVPLAPACLVIRALTPIYAAHLPVGSVLMRHVWILISIIITFVMLTSFKLMIGMALRKHSTWHIKRCQGTKLHPD